MFETIPQVLLAVGTMILVSLLSTIVYRLHLYPHSRFAGPRLWAVSRLPYVYHLLKGDVVQRICKLHAKYGAVVRIAPTELSFITAQAWHDIYGHHQGCPKFPKNPLWMAPGENGVHSILSANDADHSRYRRLLAHAFSERALLQQEWLVQSYVDLFIRRLKNFAFTPKTLFGKPASGPNAQIITLNQWLNFTTFDIMGDLALGESFHCLENGKYDSWISILFTQFKAATLFVSLRFFGLDKLVRPLLPKSLLKKRADHAKTANDRIHRRIDLGVKADEQRVDFMTYILRHNDDKGMTVPEIEQTQRILVAAGSETTATALTGIVANLLRTPDVLDRLTSVIRGTFDHESQINAKSVAKLYYLTDVIDEGLRLCPPVPLGMPRVVPDGGAEVDGTWVPGGTFVSAPGYSSNRSPLNFPDGPDEFRPARHARAKSINSISAFNPFSLGSRNCLGRNLAYMEMRLMLAHMLFHFDLVIPEGEEVGPWEDQKSWILWEKKPLKVKVQHRR